MRVYISTTVSRLVPRASLLALPLPPFFRCSMGRTGAGLAYSEAPARSSSSCICRHAKMRRMATRSPAAIAAFASPRYGNSATAAACVLSTPLEGSGRGEGGPPGPGGLT